MGGGAGGVRFLTHPHPRPLSLPPALSPAHLLLKSFSKYLLKWAKLDSHLAARGPGGCDTYSSSPAPEAVPGAAAAAAPGTVGPARTRSAEQASGEERADSAAGCHVTSLPAQEGPVAGWLSPAPALTFRGARLPPGRTQGLPGARVSRPNGMQWDMRSDAHKRTKHRGHAEREGGG